MSIKKQAIKGFLWTFLEKFSSKFISFGVSIALARLILPEEFGLLGLVYLFVGVGTVLINSGLANSLIRTKNPNDEDYSTVFYYNLGLSFLIFTILFFSSPYISDFYKEDRLTLVIRLYSLTFIFDALGSIQKTILTINLDFKKQMMVTIPSLIMSSIVSVTLAYMGFGVWSLVWGAIVSSLFVALQYWFYSKWKPVLVFSKRKFKKHFLFGYKLTLAGIINIITNNIYYVIIGKFFTLKEVGYYQRAESLKDLPVSSLSMVLDKVTYPIFAKIQEDSSKLKNAYKQVMQMAVFIIAPTIAILIVIAKTLFISLFTEKWLEAAPYFQIIAVGSVLYPIQVYNVNILKIKNRTDLVFKIVLFTRVVSILLVLLVFKFGIYMLLWTQVFIAILFFIIYSYYSGRLINYSTLEQIKDILPSIILGGVMALMLYFVYLNISDLNNILILLISIVSGYFFYFIIAYFLKMPQIIFIKQLIKTRKI